MSIANALSLPVEQLLCDNVVYSTHIYCQEAQEVLEDCSPEEIRIPFRNMVYIGDSDTDIPCMKLVTSYGGHSIGVYDPDTGDKTKVYKMIRDRRIKFFAPADYREGTQLDGLVKAIIDRTVSNESLEDLCSRCRQEVAEAEKVLRRMLDQPGMNVLIMRQPCATLTAKTRKKPVKVWVDQSKCLGEGCGCDKHCSRVWGCPGNTWDFKKNKALIDPVTCVGCGVCAKLCPSGAIKVEGPPQNPQILWGEEEQGSGRSFARKGETEQSGLCDDEVEGKISYETV